MSALSFNIDPDEGAGYDYASLNAWDAAQQQDLTDGDGDTMTAVCRCTGGTADTTACQVYTWTTGPSNWIRIWTDPNESYRHNGKWSATKYRLSAEGTYGTLDPDVDYFMCIGLQIDQTGTEDGIVARYQSAGNSILIDKCIIRSGDTSDCHGVHINDPDVIIEVKNTVIYTVQTGIYINDSSTVNLFNITVSDCGGFGLVRLAGTAVVKNSAVFNTPDDFYGTWSIDYCASDDGEGTNAVDISPANGSEAEKWVLAFTDYVNKDFSVKDADSVLYNAGVDLSGDGVAYDIIGTPRPQGAASDIGAFEYAAAAAAKMFILSSMSLEQPASSYVLASINLEHPLVTYVLSSLHLHEYAAAYSKSSLTLEQFAKEYIKTQLLLEQPGVAFTLLSLNLEDYAAGFTKTVLNLEDYTASFIKSNLNLELANSAYILSSLLLEVTDKDYLLSSLRLQDVLAAYSLSSLNLAQLEKEFFQTALDLTLELYATEFSKSSLSLRQFADQYIKSQLMLGGSGVAFLLNSLVWSNMQPGSQKRVLAWKITHLSL